MKRPTAFLCFTRFHMRACRRIAATLLFVCYSSANTPVRSCRCCPARDAFFYVNLKWIRTFNAARQLPPVSADLEYRSSWTRQASNLSATSKKPLAVHYLQDLGRRDGRILS